MERDRILASHEVGSTLIPGANISYCYVAMQSISNEQCKELTFDPANNKKCQMHSKQCTSKFRACPICLKQHEHVKMAGHLELISCEKGKTVCKFHHVNGDFRRTDPERMEEIKKFEQERARREQMIGPVPQKEVPPVSVTTPSSRSVEKNVSPGLTRRELFTAAAQKRAEGYKVEAKTVKSVSVPESIALKQTLPVEMAGVTNSISNAVDVEVKVVEKVAAEVVVVETRAETLPPAFPVPVEKAEVGDLEIGKLINFHEVDEGGVAKEVVAEVVSKEFEANWDEIKPYKNQPRKKFNKLRLQQLAGSIEEEGQLMPVLLKSIEHEKYKWELVDGERRYRAAEIIERKTLKAILIEVKDDFDHYRKSVIANLCREGHTPQEEACAIQFLLDGGYTQAKAAKLFGKSVSWVSKRLLLLELHSEVQEMMDEDLPRGLFLKTTIAEYVAEIKDKEEQLKAAKNILAKRMTTTQAYNYVRKEKLELGQMSEKKRRPSDDFRNLTALVQRTKSGVAPFTSMESEKMWELFRNRPDKDRENMFEQVETVLEEFKKLRQLLLWM